MTGERVTGTDREQPTSSNAKVTKQDWLRAALDVLVNDGLGEVKILTIGERLGVSRSSFYWYFKSREELLDALLEYWEATNTAHLVNHAERPTETITAAVCNVFKCFIDPLLFDNALDFAVRDWAKRSAKVRKILVRSDQHRVEALKAMFIRFGYDETDALTRARTLYFMQIGYNVADLNETMEERSRLVPYYVKDFTGIDARPEEIMEQARYIRAIIDRSK